MFSYIWAFNGYIPNERPQWEIIDVICMKKSEIKKWSVCLLYVVILVLLFHLEMYIVLKTQNYNRHAVVINLEQIGRIVNLILKSCSITLFVLLIVLLMLHKKLLNLRLQLKVMIIITFILELVFVYQYCA